MSSYVYMVVLESAPERYDQGIHWLSRGAVDRVYERVAELAAAPGSRVLDVGCGTGNLSIACAERGARVVGIDRDAGMLEVARGKPATEPPVQWVELGALEIEDRFGEAAFDAAVSSLMFSELGADAQDYVLGTLRSRVRPGGLVVVADEVVPEGVLGRIGWWLRRAPAAAAAWLLTQTTTRPVRGLVERFEAAGLEGVTTERLAHDFVVVWGRVPR